MEKRPTREIERQLQAVRRRIRRVQLWRGGLLAGAVFLGGLFISMALDWAFAPLFAWMRWFVFSFWMLALAFSLWKGFGPFFQKLSLVRIARWVEGRHPEMEERLSTALEISNQESASPELMASLVAAAEEDVLLVDAKREVRPGRTTRKWRWIIGGAFVLLLLGLTVFPQTAGRLFVRSVAPFSEVGNAGAQALSLHPGDLEVMEGGAVELKLTYAGLGEPEILLDFESAGEVAQPFRREGKDWVYRLEPVRETFRYRARVGRIVSDQYLATVLPRPELLGVTATKKFPDYTGQSAQEEPLGDVVEGVVGTRVRLQGKLNTAMETATLALPDGRKMGVLLEPSASEEKLEVEFELTPELGGEAVLTASHRLGGEMELARFQVISFLDEAPRVQRISPAANELKVRAEERIRIEYEVRDDFGLAAVVLEVEGGEKLKIEQDLPSELGNQRPRRYRGTTEFLVADLMGQLGGGNEMQVRIGARDRLPTGSGGPGWGYSEWLEIKVSKGAQSLLQQELSQEHEDARSGVEEAIRETREAEQKMRQSWQHLVEQRQNKKSTKIAREAQEKLSQAVGNLTVLSEEVAKGIHTAKTPQVEAAEKSLQEALAEFEKVSLQDEREERASGLEKALQNARETIATLEKLRNEINQDRAKVDDLARLQDLAQKQDKLARQAEQSEGEQSPDEKWQRAQKAVAQEVKSQVQQRPEALAEALQQQVVQAKELSKKAKELAQSQAALSVKVASGDSAEKPESKGGSEEQLRKELQKAQTEIANEISQVNKKGAQTAEAKKLAKEAQQAAYQAAKAISQKQNEKAAEKSQQAAEKLQEGAAQDADETGSAMEALAKRQLDVAEAVKALGEGEREESFAERQETSQAAIEKLGDEIQAMSQLQGSSLAQAGQETRRGQQQAKRAGDEAKQGRDEQSSQQHQQAAQSLGQASKSLAQASEQLQKRAEELSQQTPPRHQAPASPEQMAQGLQSAEQAARTNSAAEAARKAREAAQALSAAARASREEMQGSRQVPDSLPSPPGNSSEPGEEANESNELQEAEADQGVPPELAKLGISQEDWAQIKSSLQKDVGAQGGVDVPKDYQGLVKDYFQTMSEQ